MKIVLLTTGGTIASKKNPATGFYTAGALTGDELASMCNLPSEIEMQVESVFQIPSSFMDFDHMILLKQKIEAVFKDKDVGGIVVTHGTDTLEETAYFLDLTISDKRPVVVTGSQRVPDAAGSDAFLNIRQAVLAASNRESEDIGTVVLFNEKIFSARNVTKYHSSNLDGFSSSGFGYLGVVDQDKVYYYQRPVRRETYNIEGSLPDVEIIKCYAGSRPDFITCASESAVSGLVLEAMGRGHVPPQMVDAVSEAVKTGIQVVLTSSALEGEVRPVYEGEGSGNDLQNRGIILGKDYDSKKARIKLAVLIASGREDLDKLFQM